MNQPYNDMDAFISSIFSDETPSFRSPAEPEAWDAVTIRLRLRKGAPVRAFMLRGNPPDYVQMWKCETDAMFDWYDAKIYCREATVEYAFLVEWNGYCVYFDRLGPRLSCNNVKYLDSRSAFRVIPGFHVPEWSRGAIQYQIMADRFRNGDPSNDVRNREYSYNKGYIRHAPEWDSLPTTDDYRCIYGGDLPGVREKLDYLQSLGVEAIYFNPIFISPSSHKYDTQDYDYIDPHLTVIPRDKGRTLPRDVLDNSKASLYIRRTTDPENLRCSNEWFADFCQELHSRGMKIILDGVFNHCGSYHHWMDREGLYKKSQRGHPGAYDNPRSPYRNYFLFDSPTHYYSWWNVETLPKLYYERSGELCEEIYRVAEKWASPPYCIDGWRLDVAADLGQSRAFNHLFWKEFRRRVKAVNPEVLIIAEHYGDPAEWLEGDEWDSVMNYDAFMDPLSFFLTGMEKHSDFRREDLYQNGMAFFYGIFAGMSRMPTLSAQCAMNELSNHDHSRFMTRTNGRVGRLHTVGNAAADEGIRPEIFREAAVIQMTWPGAPTIYYGDEAGLTGWTDPDNRRTYPWGREDQHLIALHRALARLRSELPVLRGGSVKPLCAGFGYIAYGRFDETRQLAVACNNTERPMILELPLRDLGVPDGTDMLKRFVTDQQGFTEAPAPAGTVIDGLLRLEIEPFSAVVVVPAGERD